MLVPNLNPKFPKYETLGVSDSTHHLLDKILEHKLLYQSYALAYLLQEGTVFGGPLVGDLASVRLPRIAIEFLSSGLVEEEQTDNGIVYHFYPPIAVAKELEESGLLKYNPGGAINEHIVREQQLYKEKGLCNII